MTLKFGGLPPRPPRMHRSRAINRNVVYQVMETSLYPRKHHFTTGHFSVVH